MLPCCYIAGDIHLGEHPTVFVRWLDDLATRPPSRLVLLGDLFEYWLETDAAVRRHAHALDRLRTLARRGWRLDLVKGNRELMAHRRLEAAAGLKLHWPKLDIVAGGVRVRVVHGDRLCRDPGYHLWAAFARSFIWQGWGRAVPSALQSLIAEGLRTGSRALHRRRAQPTQAKRPPGLDPRRVRAAAHGADVLVAGHIHQCWRRRVAGVDMMLVGDWPGYLARWVEVYPDGSVQQHSRTYEEQSGMYKVPGAVSAAVDR